MTAVLEVRDLHLYYGDAQALDGVSIAADEGAIIAIVGSNGAGKSSLIRTIAGIETPRRGAIRYRGRDIAGLPSHAVCELGVGQVAEGRQVFPTLTVRENLVATAANRLRLPDPWTVEKVFALFPQLSARVRALGGTLSGGEQQMLAIGRALMTNPRLLILDEATEGLAPLVRAEIWRCVERVRAARQSILLIDKNVRALTRVADTHYVLEKGRIVWTGTSPELARREDVQHRYLGV
jgi:branched-chain amino acid transport system ATP-binding protein